LLVGCDDVFVDVNVSGYRAPRPDCDRLLEHVASGQVEAVVLYSLSHFDRSRLAVIRFFESCQDLGVRVISLVDDIDTADPAWSQRLALMAEGVPTHQARYCRLSHAPDGGTSTAARSN
jgi:DNA invertase Pin-like site-specific DNA recombinase